MLLDPKSGEPTRTQARSTPTIDEERRRPRSASASRAGKRSPRALTRGIDNGNERKERSSAKEAAAALPAKAARASGRGERRHAGPHAGADLPVPPPRLKGLLRDDGARRLMEQFGFTNPHQIPTLEKIVINVRRRRSDQAAEGARHASSRSWRSSPGQRPVRKKAKKSIANFGLREGQEIGAAVTLRGARMWEFLDRFITVAIPRIRDFRGVSTRSFDGRGNYTLGVKEQMIFPEINYDMVESDPRHGHHVRHDDEQGRHGVRAAARAGHAVPRRRQADHRAAVSDVVNHFSEERSQWRVRPWSRRASGSRSSRCGSTIAAAAADGRARS